MTVINLKVNEKTKAGKALLSVVNALHGQPGIEELKKVKKNKPKASNSPYNSEFVKKIQTAKTRGKYTEVDPNDIWGSIGLK